MCSLINMNMHLNWQVINIRRIIFFVTHLHIRLVGMLCQFFSFCHSSLHCLLILRLLCFVLFSFLVRVFVSITFIIHFFCLAVIRLCSVCSSLTLEIFPSLGTTKNYKYWPFFFRVSNYKILLRSLCLLLPTSNIDMTLY